MNSSSENDDSNDGGFPLEVDGWKVNEDHFKVISALAKDQGRDPHEYLDSLVKWMRRKGCGPST